MKLSTTISKLRTIIVPHGTTILLFILISLIPFSIRHVINSAWNFQTGAYSDFTSLSIYISDLVLILFIFAGVLFHEKLKLPKIWIFSAFIAVGWLILGLFISDKDYLPFQAYFSTRLIFLIIFAAIIANIKVPREKLAWLFSILGALQGLIAIIQFYTQKSVGLYFLGESHLGPDIFGVAKIVTHGTKFIRAYGTFPHSNLLAAFLVAATLFNLFLLTKSIQKPRGIILFILLCLNIFGIFLTLSRGGILGFVIGVGCLGLFLLLYKRKNELLRIILPIFALVVFSSLILAPYLNTRATISDPAVKDRLFYDEIGKKMIEDRPIIGLGAGTSMLHMKQYSGADIQPWDIQPIHNFYIISWAELGIGAIPFLLLIIYPIFALFKRNMTIWSIILLSIGISFFTLFLFDHYFYTIWPTKLLLWSIIGLALKEKFHVEQDDSSL